MPPSGSTRRDGLLLRVPHRAVLPALLQGGRGVVQQGGGVDAFQGET